MSAPLGIISKSLSNVNSMVKKVENTVNNAANSVKSVATVIGNEFARGTKDIIVDPFKKAVSQTVGAGTAIGAGKDMIAAKQSGASIPSAAKSVVPSAIKGTAVEVLVRTAVNAFDGYMKYVTGQQPKR